MGRVRKMESGAEKEVDKKGQKGAHKELANVRSRKSQNVESLARSALEIAAMQETRLLDPHFCDDNKIIYPEMSDRTIANNFREIRTKMLTLSEGQNFIAMVTSVGNQGGSSFVSLNLASAFSFEESKTSILVDCNLRHPCLHSVVGLEQDKGLTDYLEDTSINLEDIIYSSGLPRMRMIPVGNKKESVAEYFTSVRMKRFLDNVHSRYMDRFIFLDAPPIGESVDARILAELCDFVVLVVEYGKVTRKMLQYAVDSIGRNKLAGVVFNREPDLFFM